MRIDCPFCGERDHSEFIYEYDGAVVFPALDASEDDWCRAVFERENKAGRSLEIWQHQNGCRMWLIVDRDTTTHEIFSVKPAHHAIQELLEGQT